MLNVVTLSKHREYHYKLFKSLNLFDLTYIFEQFKIGISHVDIESTVTWTAIIQAYSMHGKPTEAMKLFKAMQIQQITPNALTFQCLLNACSHGGKVNQAWDIFCSMKEFAVEPNEQHHACMVDVWGR